MKITQKNYEEIKKLKFGDRKYKDWVSFNKVHDYTVTKKVYQPSEEIKSESVRELIKLIEYNLDIEDLQVSKLEDTIVFLNRVQEIVSAYERELELIVNSPENYNEQVVIFDGTKENTCIDLEGMYNNDHALKANLLNKIKLLKVRLRHLLLSA